jgi:Transcriptional regulatory protein, C terminal
VLALLALQRGKPVSADRLIDALWGDRQVANPVNALQAQIGHLRRTLGATAIVTSEAGHALDIGPDDVDAARFEQLVVKGRRLLEAGQSPPRVVLTCDLGGADADSRGYRSRSLGVLSHPPPSRGHL